jgi:hypothetical protein
MLKGRNGRTKMLVVSSPFLRCFGKIEKCYGSHHISSLAPISLLNQAREIPFLSSISVVPFSLVCVSPLPSTPLVILWKHFDYQKKKTSETLFPLPLTLGLEENK